ncbi:site-2 protease family protein [Candidatus Peregrinibacteria bacterium]|nr:site-2 protease family protein [Candidatus Peregrinibacteria bacterium]
MIFLSIIAFIVIFSVLILVHEWGHFAAARRSGIQVEEFGIGLPPRAKTLFKDKKGTVYSINWIPFGGFVRLRGEDNTDPAVAKDPKSFAGKTLLQRSGVILAGVGMNFILAWLLLSIGFMIGMKPLLVNQQEFEEGIKQGIVQEKGASMFIQQILKEGAAQAGGLKQGDAVTEINGTPLTTLEAFKSIIKPETIYDFTILRGKETLDLKIKTNPAGKMGFEFVLAPLYEVKELRLPFYVAPVAAAKEVARLSFLTVKMFGNMIVNLIGKLTVPEGVSGPVGIARMTYYFTQQGLVPLMQFAAVLSISLGVINVMPFPALDGGRFLFIIFEMIARRRANARWEVIIHSIGFVLLMTLILVITWNDIAQLINP